MRRLVAAFDGESLSRGIRCATLYLGTEIGIVPAVADEICYSC